MLTFIPWSVLVNTDPGFYPALRKLAVNLGSASVATEGWEMPAFLLHKLRLISWDSSLRLPNVAAETYQFYHRDSKFTDFFLNSSLKVVCINFIMVKIFSLKLYTLKSAQWFYPRGKIMLSSSCWSKSSFTKTQNKFIH